MKTTAKKMLIGILILLITYYHYGASDYFYFLHIIHRELYFIPIILAALWFGKKGGLSIAILCAIFFLPKILLIRSSETYQLSNLLEIPFYLVIGFLIGYIQDVRRDQWKLPTVSSRSFMADNRLHIAHKVLICIYNSPVSNKLALYVAKNLIRRENISIAILGFVREPSVRHFENAENYSKAKSDNEAAITRLVEEAHIILRNAENPDKELITRIVKVDKTGIASEILAEQRRESYDMVVIPGVKMSKAEEFILGNVAVKLVREIDCPVVTVF